MNPHDGESGTTGDPDPTPTAPITATGPATTEMAGEPSDAADATAPLDLARIERDLDGVEAALRRLDDGSYWTDEVTGAALPDELLEADPVARRAEA